MSLDFELHMGLVGLVYLSETDLTCLCCNTVLAWIMSNFRFIVITVNVIIVNYGTKSLFRDKIVELLFL